MLVSSFAYHLNQLNTRKNCLRLPERFESHHQFYPPFDGKVILLNQIVQVLTLSDFYAVFGLSAGIEFGKGGGVCTAFINGQPVYSPLT